MKLGVFGGSFDPVHFGHLAATRQAARQFELDKILWIPASTPPHKRNGKLSSPKDRLAMLRLALREEQNAEIDECELQRGGVSYTVETLWQIRDRVPTGTKLFLILGEDSWEILSKWKYIQIIVQWVRILTFRREGFSGAVEKGLEEMKSFVTKDQAQKVREGILGGAPVSVSSTRIRETASKGGDLTAWVPQPVVQYIQKHGLYR